MNVKVQLGLLVSALMGLGQMASAQGYPAVPSGAVPPPQYCPPGYAHGPANAYCPPGSSAYAELLPEDRFALQPNEVNLLKMSREALRNTYFRVEYLNGEIFRHDQRTIGTPLDRPGSRRPDEQFLVFSTNDIRTNPFTTGNGFATLAEPPTTGDLNWDELSGIRATLGLPIFNKAAIEIGFWGLEDTSDDLNAMLPQGANPLNSPNTITETLLDGTTLRFLPGPNGTRQSSVIAIPLTTDGEPGNRLIIYDAEFTSRYSSSVWSMDVNMVYDWIDRGDGFTFKPLIGYRHEEYGERLTFRGTFDNRSEFLIDPTTGTALDFEPGITNFVDSKVYNYRDAVQLGFRSELEVHKYVQLGVEPKVALGTNLIRSSVATGNVREPGDRNIVVSPRNAVDDPAMTREFDREMEFAPSVDVGLYANVWLREWFKLKVGYNFIWMGRLGVADDALRLNEVTVGFDNADPLNPFPITEEDVGLRKALRDRNIGVFTIGGEIILP